MEKVTYHYNNSFSSLIANDLGYNTAKDFNNNSTFLNSVLAKLARLSTELQGLQDIFKDCKSSSSDTKTRKDEMEVEISNEVELIRKDLYTKLNGMLNALRDHQTSQQADALKLQQEISMLKKEKLDLYQKINELQKRITDMELTIGQDINAFAN